MTMRLGKTRPTTLVLGLGVVGAIVVLLTQGVDLSYWKAKVGLAENQNQVQTELKVRQDPETGGNPPPLAAAAGTAGMERRDPQQLNDHGVELIVARREWEGLYYLEQAILQDPARITPMINMSVALRSMGLDRPAQRYREMAENLDPHHPWLQQKGGATIEATGYNRGLRLSGIVPGSRDHDLPADGVRLWNDPNLILWGIDGDYVY